MSLKPYFGWTSIIAVGLLTCVKAPAQQPRETGEKVTTTNESRQLKTYDPLNASIGPSAGLTAIATATPNDAAKAKENETRASGPEDLSASRKLEPPTPFSLPKDAKLTRLDEAYLDAFSILRQDNACSRFYGPPAIDALNTLTRQLKPSYFDRGVALRMRGKTMLSTNYISRLSYRRFEKAELNLNGPFYKSSFSPTEATVLRIGEFPPNTREARLTILLHEIGHMIQTPDSRWVLPDDGENPALSKQNTERVIAVCGDQIRSRSRVSFAQELLSAQTPPDSELRQLEEASQPAE